MATAPWIVSDELWELIEPLLPKKERRFRYPGRKRLSDRQALQGSRAIVDSSQIQAKKGASKRARARSTGAVPAPSSTFSSMPRASLSPGA